MFEMIDGKSISLSYSMGLNFIIKIYDMMLMVHIVRTIRAPPKKRRYRETHVCLCTSTFSSGHQSFPDFLTQVKFFTPLTQDGNGRFIILFAFRKPNVEMIKKQSPTSTLPSLKTKNTHVFQNQKKTRVSK